MDHRQQIVRMRRGRVPELGLLLLAYQLFKNIGLTNIPPVSLLAILGQVGVYLQLVVVPRLCLSGTSVWYDGDYMRLWVPAFRHTNDIHLYYNMVSLAWKGLEMERRLGSFKYLVTLAVLVVTSSSIYVLLALLELVDHLRRVTMRKSGAEGARAFV